MSKHNFKELIVWQKSKDLVIEIYRATECFPKSETFGITSQIRRSAVSIPSNIAEGCGRSTDLQLKQFLDFAYGSANELETQILVANELNYLKNEDGIKLSSLISEVQKMIFGFKKSLR